MGPAAYEFETSELAVFEAGMDSSAALWMVDPPLIPVSPPARILDPEEVELLLAMFSSIEVLDEQDPDCVTMSIDASRILMFWWDDFMVTDYACAEPRMPRPQSEALLTFLQSMPTR
jgi:hypothetical protein